MPSFLSRLAAAFFFLAEDADPDAGGVADGDEAFGDLLVAFVEGGIAADEVEDVDLAVALHDGDSRALSAQSPRAAKARPKGLPLTSMLLTAVRTSSPGKAPSMRVRFLRISRILLTCSMLAGQMSWQARQVVQAQRASCADGFDQVAGRVPFGQFADLLDDLHRGKRFVGGMGRAAVLAAFAGGAGVGIEDVFPGQVGDGCGAELLDSSHLPD